MIGSNLTIFRKGLLLIGLPFFLQLIFLGMLLHLEEQSNEADRWAMHTQNVIALTEETYRLLAEAVGRMRGMVVTGNPDFAPKLAGIEGRILPNLDRLEALVHNDPTQAARIREFRADTADMLKWLDSQRELVRGGHNTEAASQVANLDGERTVRNVRDQLRQILAEEKRLDDQRLARVDTTRLQTYWSIGAAAAATLFLAAIALVLFTRGIAARLAALAENAARLADRKPLAHQVEGQDEIGQVGQAFASAAARLAEAEAAERGYRDELERRANELAATNAELLTQANATRALAEAEAAGRAKDRFLAILSHELRTPLTPVLTAVQMLESMDELPPDLKQTLNIISRNVELEARLIDDLLDLTRISRGKLQLQPTPTDLHEKLANALQTVQDEARGKRLNIQFDRGATHTTVMADPTRLQQVFWNLLKNAVKFTPEGGQITMKTFDVAPDRVGVEISDTGIGIDPEALARIFDAFEQANRQVTRQFGGLGLGLNISKALIEAHGGHIRGSSAGVGKGATFTVELPAIPVSQKAVAAPQVSQSTTGTSTAPESRNNPHVLLVEDHRDTAMMMSRFLRRCGYQVTVADSVASALKTADAEHFDVVVSDIGLPDGSGLDLMRQLIARHSLKGIALSGFGMEEDIRRSKEAGFVEHLVKPINVQQLEAALERVVKLQRTSGR